jgi:hypothetical protein
MQVPRQIFGAARNIENGGSLTMLGTALIDTGSRMDEVIFQEFKGTGNMELVLSRSPVREADLPVHRHQDVGTRKEEKLYGPTRCARSTRCAGRLVDRDPETAMLELLELLQDVPEQRGPALQADVAPCAPLVALAALACLLAAPAVGGRSRLCAPQAGTLIDGTGAAPRRGVDVLVKDGKIAQVGAALTRAGHGRP